MNDHPNCRCYVSPEQWRELERWARILEFRIKAWAWFKGLHVEVQS
jgi:hypothetical protein